MLCGSDSPVVLGKIKRIKSMQPKPLEDEITKSLGEQTFIIHALVLLYVKLHSIIRQISLFVHPDYNVMTCLLREEP